MYATIYTIPESVIATPAGLATTPAGSEGANGNVLTDDGLDRSMTYMAAAWISPTASLLSSEESEIPQSLCVAPLGAGIRIGVSQTPCANENTCILFASVK